MNIEKKKNHVTAALLVSAGVLCLSACGGGSSGNDTTDPYVPPVTQPSFPSQVAAPSVAVIGDSGSLIIAESGLSLYTFDNDTSGTSNCDGTADDTNTCAGAWPPLLAADGATATTKMTIIERSTGDKQWAYNDMPLYQYNQDKAQGDINGDGANDVWHLARPKPIKTATVNDVLTYIGNQTVLTASDNSGELTMSRVDKNGFTLYTFDNDSLDSSACSGGCVNSWPPLLADSGAMASGLLTVVNGVGENKQWAYKGKPLYFFNNDTEAGQVKGDKVGNVWHVADKNPATFRTFEDTTFLSAIGRTNVLMPVGESTTKFEVVAVDKGAFTLYTFDNDSEGASNCTEQCLVNWPAFVPSEGEVAVGNYSIFERADGTTQWAYKGMPLYFFKNDTESGQKNGDGTVWHIIEPDAPSITTSFTTENNDLGNVITVNGQVHVLLADDEGTSVDTQVDKTGSALYTFDNDTSGVSTCLSSCLNNWPPLLADDTDTASMPFSIITRTDNGMKQWAVNGMPLYFYAADETSDDATGDNVGNKWRIARSAPIKIYNHATENAILVGHGNVLASEGKTADQLQGLTLYTYASDEAGSGTSKCTGSCATSWPPLYANAKNQAFGDYTIITRDGGYYDDTYQWAYKGKPLYFNKNDSAVGDVKGKSAAWPIARP